MYDLWCDALRFNGHLVYNRVVPTKYKYTVVIQYAD